jgi:hypothetical protein
VTFCCGTPFIAILPNMRGETKRYPLFVLEKDNKVANFLAVLKALSLLNYFQPSQLATETSTNSKIQRRSARQIKPTVLCNERAEGSSPGKISSSGLEDS